MRLSAHFRSEEFAAHDGTPVPEYALAELEALCVGYLEPLRRRWGTTWVHSGFRTRAQNISTQGAPHSYHLYERGRYGVAADVSCRRGAPADWYATLERLRPGGLGLYTTHVHVDNRRGLARW